MIYPFDASYAQKVLRIHYEYADVIDRKRKARCKNSRADCSRPNTRNGGKDTANAAHRRELSSDALRIEARAA